jgi:rhodanese-related sulfurtransferase
LLHVLASAYNLRAMAFEFKQKIPNPNFENVFDVTAEEVNGHIQELTLIDVRQPEEFTGELGHVQSSKLIVLNEIPNQIKNIPTDKPIVFICRSGMRSAQASGYAHSLGIKNTYNMLGGMIQWNKLSLPTEK